MAGAGYRQFTPGQILTAEQVQTYLQDQAVLVFNNSAARSSALGTFVSEGMLTYLKDTDALEVYDGANWDNVNDNTNAILKNTFTAAGQLIYSSGSATPVALGAGEVGQYLKSDGTAVSWAAVEAGGGSVWFNFVFNAAVNNRWFYPLGSGLYWLQAFDKDGGTGPTGNVIAWSAAMSPVATASLTANTAYGDSLARLSIASTATYLSFGFNQDALVVLTNAGSPVAVDATGAPTIITASTTVVLTQSSNVYLLGGGASGQGTTGAFLSGGGGGAGYLTALTAVPAGTYTVTIGAGGTGTTGSIVNGGSTIFGTLGTALGGSGRNGGSGGGSGNESNSANTVFFGGSGGVNGGNGGNAQNGTTPGTGSGVQLPWFLAVQAAATAPSQTSSEGGRQYGGGAGGATDGSFNRAGGSATGYGGGGGGYGGIRTNGSQNAASGGNGASGAVFITAA